MNKKAPPKRRESGTVAKLAKALKYTTRHTGSLLAKGMPATITEARLWLSEREDNDTAAALRKERIGLVRAQRLAVELSNKKANGELVERIAVDSEYVRIAMAMQAFLRKLERELPQVCLGLSLSQSAPLVKTKVREIQQAFSDMSEEFFTQPK